MAPRGRFLDLEREDVLFFYGAYSVVTTTHAIVFWPVFLVSALLLHVMAPFPHAAAVCGTLYVAYCFLLDRASAAQQASSSSSSESWPSTAAARSTTRGTVVAVSGYNTIEQKSQ